jgi:hypothetical protein
MSKSNPFDDLAKAVGFMNEIGSRHSKLQELQTRLREMSIRLQHLERSNDEAAALLKYGPKGFGGPEEWMKARDTWLAQWEKK